MSHTSNKVLLIGSEGKIGKAIHFLLHKSGRKVDCLDLHNTGEFDPKDYSYIATSLPSAVAFPKILEIMGSSYDTTIVDVSYMEEDPMLLNAVAQHRGHTLVVDAGLAPGLTNMLVGRQQALEGFIDNAELYVGGVTIDPTKEYKVQSTWNVDDLFSEYGRPARFVLDHKEVSGNVLGWDTTGRINVPGIGPMDYFISDGCRTLLQQKWDLQHCMEATLRWPGHVAQIRRARDQGKLNNLPRTNEPDMVILYAVINIGEYRIIDLPDKDGFSAMQRTTGFTAAETMNYLIDYPVESGGIYGLEHLGRSDKFYNYMRDRLALHGVIIEEREDIYDEADPGC